MKSEGAENTGEHHHPGAIVDGGYREWGLDGTLGTCEIFVGEDGEGRALGGGGVEGSRPKGLGLAWLLW